jgi:hypothetical protein
MTKLITDCEYEAYQVEDAFYELYGSEMVHVGDGFQYTAFELLRTLDGETRKEVLEYLGEAA